MHGLKQYKDYCIESELSTGDKTLSFLYPLNLAKEIKEEGYIRNKTDEFVIKGVSTQGKWKSIKAKLNVEDLEGKVFESFDTTNETITECINLALAGTGWIVGSCDVTKRRTVRKTNSSSWDIIQEARKVYRCELEFDTLNKKVNIYEKRGSDKGAYFLDSLNLKNLSIQSDSYDFYTRIIAKGKDNLKVTLENFQYSKKIKTYIWKDERYTDIESLTEDAEAKLDELSKPYRAYSATVIDLANISKEDYKDILSYSLGDVITLVSKENGIKEKQRIVKIVEYPDEPTRNTCEIANTTLSFEDVQKEFQDTSDTVNNITTDNGTIDGSTINGITTEQIYDFEASVVKITDLTIVNARIDQLYAEKANISELNAVIANVAELNATKANITDLNAINANIQNLKAADATINNALIGKADITELNAVKGTINSLDSKIANIETLVNGNLSSENIQAGGITSDKLTIANGFITNAMIANLDVSKINAGDFSTNKFRIVSDSGKMLIADNTIQIRDNNRVRVQIGKDASNDYSMYVWDSAGKLMFDATGLKADGIKNKIIRDDMISDNANIDGSKINISSLITEINKDTNTTVIKSSKVQLDTLGQTLDVAFNSLKSNVDNMEIGGRNLWIKSKTTGASAIEYLGENHITGQKECYKLNNGATLTFNIEPAFSSRLCRKVTFSAWVKYENVVQGENNWNKFNCFKHALLRKNSLTGATTTSQDFTTLFGFTGTSDWKRITSTYDYTFNGYDQLKTSLRFNIEGAKSGTAWVTGIKVELGDKATDYSDALEDVDSSIESVKQITESNSTTISVMQGQIATAINNTQIVKDGQTVLLKDDYNRTVAKVDSINSTIGSHTTKMNELTGSITSVDTKVNSVQRDLEGTKSTVSSHTSQINGLNSTVSTQGASISQLKNQIALKVEQTDINAAINNISIGGRNLWIEKNLINAYESNGNTTSSTSQHKMMSTYTELNGDKYVTVQLWNPNSINNNSNSNRIAFYDSNKTWISSINTPKPNGTSYVSGIITVPTNAKYMKIGMITGSSQHESSIKIKVELGNKPTDWTQAPEDVDSSIANVQTQVTTTSNKVATIETNLSSITQRVSATESTTSTLTINLNNKEDKNNRVIYARGSGNDYSGTRILKIGNTVIYNGYGRGAMVTALIPSTLEVYSNNLYDLHAGGENETNFVNKINELNEGDYIIIVTSQDNAFLHYSARAEALYKIGGLAPKPSVVGYREAYALIGRSKLGKGNGVEMYIPKTAEDKRFAEVSVKISDNGAFMGVNSPNIGNEIDTVTTAITTTSSKVATIETNLNSITQRVSSTESTVSTHTSQLSTVDSRINTAKNSAISTAASDATTKANNAQTNAVNSAKSYTDGQITTVNKTITNKVAEIKATTDSITQRVSSTESKITTITTDFNNLKIGGTNLATETNKGATGWGWSLQTGGKTATEVTENGIRCCKLVRDSVAATGWSYISYNRIGRNKYLPNRKYTVSFEVKASVVTSFYVGLKEGNSANPLSGDVKTGNTVVNTWTKLSATITTLSTLPSSTSQVLYLNGMNSGTGVTYIFRNLKIEEGTKESNWSPAPEDVDTSIANVQTQITNTSNKVATIETNLNSITSRVSSTETKVTTINGNITSLQSRMNTAEQKITPTAITTTISSTISGGTGSISTTQFVMDKNGLTINNGALIIKNKAGKTVLSSDSNGNLLYTGALYAQVDSSHYAKIEPILTNNNKDVKLRLSLVGNTEHSNFDVVNAAGVRLFKVGHGGVEIHKYLTLDTDQTGTYNTRCYWENGTYRPAVAEKALIGTNTYYFNSVFSRYFGRDRISGSYTTVQAGAVNIRTAYQGEGCYFDTDGYFRPAAQGAWANGHPSYRWSTLYSVNGVNASSDLRLKENVEYIQETNGISRLSSKGNNITQEDMYNFIKDEFKLASYNYKGEKFEGNTELSYNLGFIAQDLKDSNVGKQFIIPPQEEEGAYSYNMGSYIGVLAGALRIAINKIESLENRIKVLESKGA